MVPLAPLLRLQGWQLLPLACRAHLPPGLPALLEVPLVQALPLPPPLLQAPLQPSATLPRQATAQLAALPPLPTARLRQEQQRSQLKARQQVHAVQPAAGQRLLAPMP